MNTLEKTDQNSSWAFRISELTAGLRQISGDPALVITEIVEAPIPDRLPSIGRISGIQVTAQGLSQVYKYSLVMKEPQGTTRTGTAGAGRREVSLYRALADQLPVNTPKIIATDSEGDWLILDRFPNGLLPEKWSANDYTHSLDDLIRLHDRFWGLGVDLAAYPWLGKPLTSDFDIHLQAASNGLKKIENFPGGHPVLHEPTFSTIIRQIIKNAPNIASRLLQEPSTLLHGDYWPGNIHRADEQPAIVFDWQKAAVGPGILDLVVYIQQSQWWFNPLPINPSNLIQHYREGIEQCTQTSWNDLAWKETWEYALLWVFFVDWIDLLATTPPVVIETRLPQLKQIWLDALQTAVEHYLPKE